MTAKGGTRQSCAVCKYQRRKCAADCQLAPYFPADEPRQFQNAHRLFGVSNIHKILDRIDPSQHPEAMRSIKFEANMRDRYPVHGCLGVIYALLLQIHHTQLELEAVTAQLAAHRRRHGHHLLSGSASPPPPASPTAASNLLPPPPSQLQLTMHHPGVGNDDDNSYALSLFLGNDCPSGGYPGLDAVGIGVGMGLGMGTGTGTGTGTAVKNEHEGGELVSDYSMQQQLWGLRSFHDSGTNNSHDPDGATKASLAVSQSPGGLPGAAVGQEYDEISPYLDNIDDRQSYVDCKVHSESSSEESMKDTVQSVEKVSQNDLKSAAACFSLTSVIIN